MRKLELEPDTYEFKFTALTKGVNLKVKDWIIDHVGTSKEILEVGCGTGKLAAEMAIRGNNVLAIDKNPQMINIAMKNYPTDSEVDLLYQIGTVTDLPAEDESKNIIVSTFLLSELRPFEQILFLRNAWKALKPNGRVILAAEFIPSGFWKLVFKIKRWWYRKKLRRLRLPSTFLVKWFYNYIEPIGFKLIVEKKWKHGSIKVLELQKTIPEGNVKPGFYQPKLRKFKGLGSQLNIYRCILTGQVDHVPIEPGIYPSGNPNEESPIIVTANYIYTYIKVMRALKGIDAWVLCVDSNGINVWCAARGDNFGNKQLIEAVELSGIINVTKKKTLILPQLSAGGVSSPLISMEAPNFPFKVKFGPVWAKFLPKYLKENPAKKTDKMKLAKFSLTHRMRAGITHTTFLLRKIFFLPTLALLFLLLGLSLISSSYIDKLSRLGEIWLWIITINLILALMFPIADFTRVFIKKGIIFGTISLVILGGITWFLHDSWILILLNSTFFFWLAFFSTMSFSGYTMATSPREIQDEYPIFRKINLTLLVIGVLLLGIGLILF